MAERFTNAWRRATLPESRVPLKPGIDPEHARPTDAPSPYDTDLTGAPGLPDEWVGNQVPQQSVPGGYVDLTPQDHAFGVGMLPGVDQFDAQTIGGAARSVDMGAMDQRDFDRPSYQEDGSTHVDRTSPDWQGESPETLRYQFKGVGVDIDPDARSNRDIRRRPTGPAQYDMRWYGAEFRPRYVKTAEGSPSAVGPVANRNQFQSPYARNEIIRPDNWAQPVVRRSAPTWDQPWTTDNETPTNPAGDFGLGRWGL